MPPLGQAPKVNPSAIGNKVKRTEIFAKQRFAKQLEKKERRDKRKRDDAELGAAAPPRQKPKTIEAGREFDDTVVAPDDAEVLQDEAEDEFAPYFSGKAAPKIMLTTQRYPSAKIFTLVSELISLVPNCFYYKRGHFDLQRICKYAAEKGFTHLMVLTERLKKPNGLIVSHLGVPRGVHGGAAAKKEGGGEDGEDGEEDEEDEEEGAGGGGGGGAGGRGSGGGKGVGKEKDVDKEGEEGEGSGPLFPEFVGAAGPTAAFRLSSSMLGKEIRGHGSRSSHVPELILNGFGTRLGRRVGRLLASLFPHNPEFRGRQVATFHAQRDFIFFRQHRYAFSKEGSGVDLQELGPRFTLKLKYVLAGTMDSRGGEYEWMHRRSEADITRKTFHL